MKIPSKQNLQDLLLGIGLGVCVGVVVFQIAATLFHGHGIPRIGLISISMVGVVATGLGFYGRKIDRLT